MPNPWESAYLRFETPGEEIRKFMRRFRRLGASTWHKKSEVVELFCGRGSGLHALQRMGFTNLEGIDLSENLLSHYDGPAKCQVCDCRYLPFAQSSKDIVIVEGGLHHLPDFPADVEETLSEIRRVLRCDGLVVLDEPWLTPFLMSAHAACSIRFARGISKKVDCLATMIEHERNTYDRWLRNPDAISRLAKTYFIPVKESVGWGRWNFVGTPRI